MLDVTPMDTNAPGAASTYLNQARLTSQSAAIYERARRVLPGGVSANLRYTAPHPIYMARAEASTIWDVDGNRYIDCHLAYGTLISGHGHPDVTAAVRQLVRSR